MEYLLGLEETFTKVIIFKTCVMDMVRCTGWMDQATRVIGKKVFNMERESWLTETLTLKKGYFTII
jgi:hypothetical protein